MSIFRQSLFPVICICICSLSSFAQQPLPDSILRTLKKEHPRLLVRSLQDFEDIKTRSSNDEFLQLSMANLYKKADSIIDEPAVTYAFLDNYRMNTRNVYTHCYTLSLAYRLTANKKYSDRLWVDLEAISRFPDWNPRHFLDVGLMTQPVAVAYDWLYDVWTPEQRRIIRQQILTKGLQESLTYYDHLIKPGQFDWSAIEHNWNLVCNGNMAFGALAIAEDEPAVAERVLREALTRFPKSLQHFGPDGAWNEGPGYWSFAMRNTVPLLASLVTALGTDFGISNIAGFSKAGQFFVSIGGANDASFNYADALPVVTRAPELLWLANRFNQPLLTQIQAGYSTLQLSKGGYPQSPLEILWYRPQTANPVNTIPLDNYYRDAEVATLRSTWEGNNGWYVGFKAGDNETNHGHLDIGSYVLDYKGIRWIMDLGFENYNVPEYFGDVGKGGKRWTYYRTRAEGNNTIVINPDSSEDQDVYAKTKFDRFESGSGKSFGIMDITNAYKGKALSVKRGIAMLNRNSVLFQDEIKAAETMDVYWFSHTAAEIVISANGKTATLQKEGEKITAQLLSPANAVFTVMDAKPLPTSPNPVVNNKNEGIKKLTVHVSGSKSTTIAVAFSELNGNKKAVVKPLANW